MQLDLRSILFSTNAFYVAPIRQTDTYDSSQYVLGYNTTSKEIVYTSSVITGSGGMTSYAVLSSISQSITDYTPYVGKYVFLLSGSSSTITPNTASPTPVNGSYITFINKAGANRTIAGVISYVIAPTSSVQVLYANIGGITDGWYPITNK